MSEPRRLLLAFDFGIKRIGIATGNLLTRTASPLTTLTCRNTPPWPEIDALVADWRPDVLVVGDPGADADEALLKALAAFVTTLTVRYPITVERADERFTSAAATSSLRADRQKGIYNRRLRRSDIDSRAACLIAEQWINEAHD